MRCFNNLQFNNICVEDSFIDSNGQRFSALGEDNDVEELGLSCAMDRSRGFVGWWYANCGKSNLNGPIPGSIGTPNTAFYYGFNELQGLMNVTMKIRPV